MVIKMKIVKRLLLLIALLLLFGMLHRFTEWKFENDPPIGMTERLEQWRNKLGLE